MQCLERKLRDLHISLLELTTIARCVYTLSIYLFWWNKPFSIDEPTLKIIAREKMRAICAYMWISSVDSGDIGNIFNNPEFEWIQFCPDMVDKDAAPKAVLVCRYPDCPTAKKAEVGRRNPDRTEVAQTTQPNSSPILPEADYHLQQTTNFQKQTSVSVTISPENTDKMVLRQPSAHVPKCCPYCGENFNPSDDLSDHFDIEVWGAPKPSATIVTLERNEFLSVAGSCLNPKSERFHSYWDGFHFIREQKLYLEKHDIERWSLASLAISKYKLPLLTKVDAHYLRVEASPSFAGGAVRSFWKQISWRTVLLSALEGVLVTLAWNYPFVTDSLRKWWRYSAILSFLHVLCTMLYFAFVSLLSKPLQFLLILDQERPEQHSRIALFVLRLILLLSLIYGSIFGLVLIGVYATAKFTFLWVALVDVFYLPDEAYQVAVWSNYLPHIF